MISVGRHIITGIKHIKKLQRIFATSKMRLTSAKMHKVMSFPDGWENHASWFVTSRMNAGMGTCSELENSYRSVEADIQAPIGHNAEELQFLL